MVKVFISIIDRSSLALITALKSQEGFVISGVGVAPGLFSKKARQLGISAFCKREHKEMLENEKIPIAGTLEEGILQSDIVIDVYGELDFSEEMKVISLMNKNYHRFCATSSYYDAIGKKQLNILEPCDISASRVLYPVNRDFGIKSIDMNYITSLKENKGFVKGLIPVNFKEAEHHEENIKSQIPCKKIKIQVLSGHLMPEEIISGVIELSSYASVGDIISCLNSSSRIKILPRKGYITMEDIRIFDSRPSGCVYETIIWEDSIDVIDGKLYLQGLCHPASVFIPDVIDGIRAISNLESDGIKSIIKTDESLNIW